MSELHDEQHRALVLIGWLLIYGGTALAGVIWLVLILMRTGL